MQDEGVPWDIPGAFFKDVLAYIKGGEYDQ